MVYLFGSKEKSCPKLLVPTMSSQIVQYSQAILNGIGNLPPMVASKFIGKEKVLTFWDKFIILGRSTISKMASVPRKSRFCFFTGHLPEAPKFRGISLKQLCMSIETKGSPGVFESHKSNALVTHRSPLFVLAGPSWLTTDIINTQDVRAKNCLQHKFRLFHFINIYLCLEKFDRFNPGAINVISTSFHLENAIYLLSPCPSVYQKKMTTLVGALKGYKKYGYLCLLLSKGHFLTPDAVVNIPMKTIFSFFNFIPN